MSIWATNNDKMQKSMSVLPQNNAQTKIIIWSIGKIIHIFIDKTCTYDKIQLKGVREWTPKEKKRYWKSSTRKEA